MINFISAIIVGALTSAIRRLGPSIVIFVYLSFYHLPVGKAEQVYLVPYHETFLGAAVVVGASFMVFAKFQLGRISKKLDVKAILTLDRFVIVRVNKGDLMGPSIRPKVSRLLNMLKTLTLLTIILSICSFIFGKLAYAFGVALFLNGILGYILSWWPNRGHSELVQHVDPEKFDSYTEVAFVLAIVISILYLIPHDQIAIAAVGLLLMTRFLGSFKDFGRQVYWLNRSLVGDRMRGSKA
jgi:hypothetical protein